MWTQGRDVCKILFNYLFLRAWGGGGYLSSSLVKIYSTDKGSQLFQFFFQHESNYPPTDTFTTYTFLNYIIPNAMKPVAITSLHYWDITHLKSQNDCINIQSQPWYIL